MMVPLLIYSVQSSLRTLSLRQSLNTVSTANVLRIRYANRRICFKLFIFSLRLTFVAIIYVQNYEREYGEKECTVCS